MNWRWLTLLIVLVGWGFVWYVSTVRAEPEFGPQDTLWAVEVASRDTGVSYQRLLRIVSCETGGTFDPYIVGDHGASSGAAQINRYGNAAPVFYAVYDDPTNPYQAVYFLAEALAGWHPPLGTQTWSCK